VTTVTQGAALLELEATDIFIYSVVEGGVTAGAVLVSLGGGGDGPVIGALPACTANQEIARVHYQYKCELFEAQVLDVTASLSDGLGSPPVAITVGSEGLSMTPGVGGSVSFTLMCVEPFIRGDVNQDGVVTISDPVAIAKALFSAGNKYDLIKLCTDAADANDDGSMNVADAVYLLQYLWAHGPPIPPPTSCGFDTTPSAITPCAFSACQ
jgi:hypothetical protein